MCRVKIFLLAMTVSSLLLSASVTSSFMPQSSASVNRLRSMDSVDETAIFHLKGGAVGDGDDAIPPAPLETTESELSVSSEEDVAVLAAVEEKSPSTYMGPNASPPGFLRRALPSLPWHSLPDMLTYARCLSIPALVCLFYVPNRHIETSVLFAFASFTDWLDGYLARRWDISSDFGAFLDPVADKLMVSTSLILLAGRYGAEIAVPTSIILAREIGVSALREWMAQRGKRDIVKVGFQGKVKAALTMFSITVLLLAPSSGNGPLTKLYMPGLLMMYLSALITVTSGSVYFIAAAPLLMGKES